MFGLIFFIVMLVLALGAIYLAPRVDVQPKSVLYGLSAFFFILALFTGFKIFFTTVENQHIGYVKVFNVVQLDKTFSPGLHIKAPWEHVDEIDTAVKTVRFGEGGLRILDGLTKDQVFLQVDLSANYAVIPENVPLFKVKYGLSGNYDDQAYAIIRSAVRDTIAQTSWKEGGITDRNVFAENIRKNIEAKTVLTFKEAGLGQNSAHMIRWGAINLRKIVPPHKIQETNNDLAAADIQDQLQAKLLKIEQSRKAVRDAQATNYNSLVKVPPGMNPHQYAEVLRATTEQMNAETVANALENGKKINVVLGLGVAPQPTTNVQ